MKTPADICQLSTVELAEAIRTKKLTSRGVVESHLKRIQTLDKSIRAVVTLHEAEALELAQHADRELARGHLMGPLHGVPMLVKDCISVGGMRSTYAMPRYRKLVPKHDAESIALLRKAGAIIMGRTNLPPAAFDWQSKNLLFGRTNNPWDTSRTSGGSSGGAAAALAMGFTPFEWGSDLAGSLRWPAHCCGVFGLRPTEGLVSIAGLEPEGEKHKLVSNVVVGPMARSLDDIEYVLKITVTAPEKLPKSKPESASARKLKIGWTESFSGITPTAEYLKVFADFRQKLAEEGHDVFELKPTEEFINRAYFNWGRVTGHEFSHLLPQPIKTTWLKQMLRPGLMGFILGKSPLTESFAQGLHSNGHAYQQALEERNQIMVEFDAFMQSCDVWVTPVAPFEAFKHQRSGKSFKINGKCIPYSAAMGAFACATTAMGHPILAAPVGRTAQGLPLGLQFHGRRFHDFELIQNLKTIASLPKHALMAKSGL